MDDDLDAQPISLDEFSRTRVAETKRGIETMGGFVHWAKKQGLTTKLPATEWHEYHEMFRKLPA